MKYNNRLNSLSSYHFKKIDEMKQSYLLEGRQIYDFGIGDPDLPVNEQIIKELISGLQVNDFNKYPPYEGIKFLKNAIIRYYEESFEIPLKEDEVVVLIGSKEGLSNIIPAVCDFGDRVIVPVPGYPVYETCSRLWGAVPFRVYLEEKNGYLPRLEEIPRDLAESCKLFFVNYPNNPTGATADSDFFKYIAEFCRKYDIVLCNDGAYNEIIKGDGKPKTVLGKASIENCIEFGTLSKTFNMTGFRIGYAVGDSRIISALLKVKSNLDSGQFIPVQLAAAKALLLDRRVILENRRIYDERRNMIEDILGKKNIRYFKPEGTFYVWCKVPEKYTTEEFCEELCRNYGILVTPGHSFGNIGHGYFRIALTKDEKVIKEAFDKIPRYN